LQDGEEDVDSVQIDGEGENRGGLAVSAGADAGEVADGEEGKDAEGKPGVGVRRHEPEEDADEADQHEDQKRSEADAADTAVVDVEEIGDDAHAGHAESRRDGGLEDDEWTYRSHITMDEGANLPTHEVGEEQEEPEGERGVLFFGEGDSEDEGQDGDKAGEHTPGGRGGDASGGDEEA